jgi:hypothetical protein
LDHEIYSDPACGELQHGVLVCMDFGYGVVRGWLNLIGIMKSIGRYGDTKGKESRSAVSLVLHVDESQSNYKTSAAIVFTSAQHSGATLMTGHVQQ